MDLPETQHAEHSKTSSTSCAGVAAQAEAGEGARLEHGRRPGGRLGHR
ncbi:MAG TPA: hypothetical protein VEI83_16735 [Acidimicrobiales bacterium]|nr:hypothetical protein [Acidimicrobiales bacterium]